MADTRLSVEVGAAGRPTLSFLIEKAMCQLREEGNHYSLHLAAPKKRDVQIRHLPRVPENSILAKPASERDSLKLHMLRILRPLPLKYAWTFYHDKHSTSADYESRLTVMMEEITSIKTFWEVFNQFPIKALKLRDSVHFFKRGVKPMWEDPRNIAGGAWTFRVSKTQGLEFWKETLLLAVGEQFADIIQPGDDLCGVSVTVRLNSDLITLWNRDGTNQKSIDGILSVMLNSISPGLKIGVGSWSYEKHSERAGFNEAIAGVKEIGLAKVVELP